MNYWPGFAPPTLLILKIWLGGRDSNPDTQIQNLQSYRWTTSQRGGNRSLTIRYWHSPQAIGIYSGVDADASNTILQLAPHDCVVETTEKLRSEIFGQFSNLRHRFHRLRK